MKMSELKPGDKAVVTGIETMGEVSQRLFDMGLVKGTRFKVVRKAPLGDPIEIKMRGFMMALRMNEAEYISVEKIGEIGDGKQMGHGRGGGFAWGFGRGRERAWGRGRKNE